MTVFTNIAEWTEAARALPASHPAYAKAAFLVSPDALFVSTESASDNLYMSTESRIDVGRALQQHRRLHQALAGELPVVCFPGVDGQPDGVFPNNVFATTQGSGAGRLVVGSMRHPQRRLEAQRADIRGWFTEVLGYSLCDLQEEAGISELTGTLVIDRARMLGIAGLGPRCDLEGTRNTARAMGLQGCLAMSMAGREYHANVVLAVLGGKMAVVCADGWEDGEGLVAGLQGVYGRDKVVALSAAERAAFAGNCIALRDGSVWMSERGADTLTPASRQQLEAGGFRIRSVALDEIEKAGGSLRCCVAEIY